MELTPEEIVHRIKITYPISLEHAETIAKIIREYGEQLLKAEKERLEKQLKSIENIRDTQDLDFTNIVRLNGKAEGVEIGIENIRQTLKSK